MCSLQSTFQTRRNPSRMYEEPFRADSRKPILLKHDKVVYRNSSLDIYKNLLFTSISQDRERQRKRDLHSMFCRRSDCALCSSMRQPELVLPDAENDGSLLDAPPEVENVFCKKVDCCQCQIVEESISVHTDCFELFEKHCAIGDGENSPEQKNEKYRRLWLAGTRRYAWRKMAPLKFPSSTTLAFPQPEIISKLCGFQKIFLPEVVRLIQSYSKLHIIWRYCSAIQLAQELGSAKAEAAVIYDVPKILSWSRGSPPKVVQDKSLAGSFIRFTIDHRGIKSIDRFSDVPANTAGEIRASSCVFAVEPIEKLSDDKLKFEVRDHLFKSNAEAHIANFPSSDCVVFKSRENDKSPSGVTQIPFI